MPRSVRDHHRVPPSASRMPWLGYPADSPTTRSRAVSEVQPRKPTKNVSFMGSLKCRNELYTNLLWFSDLQQHQ